MHAKSIPDVLFNLVVLAEPRYDLRRQGGISILLHVWSEVAGSCNPEACE